MAAPSLYGPFTALALGVQTVPLFVREDGGRQGGTCRRAFPLGTDLGFPVTSSVNLEGLLAMPDLAQKPPAWD